MPEAKITRAEAAAIVNSQLCFSSDLPSTYRQGPAHHYGKQDLRYLLDAIYGPPQSDAELVTGRDEAAIAKIEGMLAKRRARRDAQQSIEELRQVLREKERALFTDSRGDV